MKISSLYIVQKVDVDISASTFNTYEFRPISPGTLFIAVFQFVSVKDHISASHTNIIFVVLSAVPYICVHTGYQYYQT